MPLIVHRGGRMKTGHRKNEHGTPPRTVCQVTGRTPVRQGRRAVPPPTGEPPGDGGVTRARLPFAPAGASAARLGPGSRLNDRSPPHDRITPRSRSERTRVDPSVTRV